MTFKGETSESVCLWGFGNRTVCDVLAEHEQGGGYHSRIHGESQALWHTSVKLSPRPPWLLRYPRDSPAHVLAEVVTL